MSRRTLPPTMRLSLSDVLYPEQCAMYYNQVHDKSVHVFVKSGHPVNDQALSKLPEGITYRKLAALCRQLGLGCEVL